MTTPLASIGIEIGKEVFHVVGFGTDGKIAFRRKIKGLALVETFKQLPPGIIGMEACLSAHFISRALRQLGHQPRIIPAIYVKPFVKGSQFIENADHCGKVALGMLCCSAKSRSILTSGIRTRRLMLTPITVASTGIMPVTESVVLPPNDRDEHHAPIASDNLFEVPIRNVPGTHPGRSIWL